MIRSLKEFAVAHRRAVLMLAHAAIFAFVHWLAFALRFDVSADRPFFIDMHPKYVPLFAITLALALSIKMAAFAYFRLFSGWWRYVGISDAVNLAKAATISALVFAVAAYLFLSPFGYPRSILLLDWMLTILVVGGLRISIRALRERRLWDAAAPSARRVLIVGAGDAGETLAREILSRPRLNYAPVGFVDDDPSKHGSYIHGVRVLGGVDDIPDIAARLNASEALIAVPSAGGAAVKRIVEACNRAGIESRTLPGLESLIDGRVSVSALRKVSIEDLLRREPVRLDERAIEGLVRDKIVLVTGAGGSIGSEICRQTARFGPRGIVLCERSENALFEIDSELRNRPGAPAVWGYVVDIRDAAEMSRILARHGPSAIFHAAAHKHVPLMERSPAEAIRNNVLGTKAIADMAGAGGVGTFVFISTDKAVGPSSVMGATKRIGEMYVLGLGSEFPRTRFVAVRFGNVLGSSGSVLPIFRKQIEAGGPVTVTHPDMERFFMTIPEAVALVIAAAATGRSGDLMALNMGEPIRIVDFARDLIRLSGLEPGRDIEITFTGIRPGEKLKESLAGPGESLEPSGQEGVSIVKSELPPRARVVEAIAALERLARDENGMSAEELRERLLGILRELERAG